MAYRIVAEGVSETSPSNEIPVFFSGNGINTYTVSVVAIGAGALSTSITTEVTVFVDYVPPAALIDKLTAGEWRIKSSANGHFGLGPVGGTIPSEFFGTPPNDKAGSGMYDDRYIFSRDFTFTHITDNTNDDPILDASGTIFGRVGFVEELNGAPSDPAIIDGSDALNYPLSDNNGTWNIVNR